MSATPPASGRCIGGIGGRGGIGVPTRASVLRNADSGRRALHSRAVADRTDLEFTYSLIDRIFRLSLGELADFSGAKYDGDFSMSLEEAQRRKHEYVAEQIGIGPDRRGVDPGGGGGGALGVIPPRGGGGGGGPPGVPRGGRSWTSSAVAAGKASASHCRQRRRQHAEGTASTSTCATPETSPARRSAGSTRWRAWEPSSTSARRRTTAPDGRRTSIASCSRGSPACCPREGGSISRRWCSDAT